MGLSFFYHDSAVVLLENGIPLAMAEEERFSRKKHDFGFPANAVKFVLEETKTGPRNLDWVIFYEKPFIKFDRIIKTLLATFPSPLPFIHGIKNLFTSKLWIRELIAKEIGISPDKILFSEHHLSHAASAFLCSPYDRAAILTIDGVGEWATTAVGIGEGSNIKILKEIHFPHSLGLLYSAFTAFLGFEINEGEYKVMGMAPYGQPKYVDKVKKLIQFFDDGSYQLNLDYFSFHRSTRNTFSEKFIELFGKPRQDADIAASIQKVLEEAVVNLAKEAYRITGLNKLCLAGGVALNSVANWKIIKETPFKEIFIQPAAGDSGGALGAALAAWHIGLKKERGFVFEYGYYGKGYTEDEIIVALKEKGINNFEQTKDEEKLIDLVADYIKDGKVIGWFQGRFEWGPRALGNRSILADPRRPEMKDIVNTKIKFREPYRPFAPSVLAEYAEDYFEMTEAVRQYPARFMLYVVPVKKDKQSVIPAVTHVDGTARPQTVFKETSPRYWKLIDRFRQKTGIPLILNTSFNLKGEPIVNTPSEALNTFLKSEMDVLVLDNFLIHRPK